MKKFLLSILLFSFTISNFAFAGDVFTPYEVPKDAVVYSTASRTINAIDPIVDDVNKKTYFPGNRKINQLVIYTKAYGPRTNTNEFGAEAIVKNNTVVALSGADSLIPEDGVVISGHGTAKTWINKNIIVGTKIYIDAEKNSITAYTTSESYIYGAKECIKEVVELMNYYKAQNPDYYTKKIEESIKDANNCIRKAEAKPSQVQEYSQLAIDYANKALSLVIPYRSTELRGVWIRPTEKNRDEVVNVVNKLANAGINNIFLETYFHGLTIFPSKTMAKYGFTQENPIFENFDVLKTYLEECHKKNIKVNIWFETFYVGNRKPSDNPNSILSVCPTWSNCTKRSFDSKTPVPCASEHNGYFLDPANPEVQTFLMQLLCEIIYSYRPDGINIDYIRYPQSNAPQRFGADALNWGYTQVAREDFKSIYGIDPVCINPCDSFWQAWCDYRRGKVTNFVRKLSQICHSNDIMLTAVVFPNRYSALANKHQDWTVWSNNNYVDGFTPLFLTCDPATASDLMKNIVKYKNPKTKLYAGIFVTFMNGSQSDLIRQIHELRKLNLNGFSIFDYAHFGDSYIQTLKQSICTPPPQPKRIIPVQKTTQKTSAKKTHAKSTKANKKVETAKPETQQKVSKKSKVKRKIKRLFGIKKSA